MNRLATKNDIEKVLLSLDNFRQEVNTQFNTSDTRFSRLETRLDKVENEIVGEIASLKQSYDHILSTVDGFAKLLTDNQIENSARDSQFNKTVVWARKVSKKVNIPLEGL